MIKSTQEKNEIAGKADFYDTPEREVYVELIDETKQKKYSNTNFKSESQMNPRLSFGSSALRKNDNPGADFKDFESPQ